MKKKKIAPQPLTKEDFEKAISKLATKDELKSLATKKNLNNFKLDIFVEISQLETRTDDKMKKYKDEILTNMDGIAKELETIREEQIIGSHQDKEFQEQLNDQAKRIKKIEQRAHAA